jgi:DNA-directed RNA polymerase specialized sigma24 family protein
VVTRRSRQAHAFREFVAAVEPRLRRALVAAYGVQVGREATAEALGWAWEHWSRVAGMTNPAGYLFRVGQTSAQRSSRVRVTPTVDGPVTGDPWVEPGLDGALMDLTEHQRVAVVLCHGFEWTQREVAELLGVALAPRPALGFHSHRSA